MPARAADRIKLRQSAHGALYDIDIDSPLPTSGSPVLIQVGHRERPKRRVDDVLGEELAWRRRRTMTAAHGFDS